jgi:hypothetical protein
MAHKKGNLGIAEIIGDKRDDILALAHKRGAFNVRVFGSVARGEAREDSDVDFIVNFEEDKDIFDQIGFWLDLKALLQRDVDLISDHAELADIGIVARETAHPL